MTSTNLYSEKGSGYFGLVRKEILELIPQGTQRLLDVGCGQGDLGAAAKHSLGVPLVVGIELFQPAAELARTKLDQVIIGDIENVDLQFPPESFDCIVCADVLEHTRDPWQVLENLRKLLHHDGVIIASLPNLRHMVPILKIIFDRFEYQDEGILDKTHLRFFTLRTIRTLFHDSGFAIDKVNSNRSRSWKFKLLNVFSLGILKEFAIYQYILVARRR
jgi:2-polyprenyl-3-methyl-5-hydroxy-6-metoxy-1,4-benzoquinol methylase